MLQGRRLVLLLVLITGSAPAVAEVPTRFERFGPEHGLSHNTVNDLIQDQQGFLWLATDDGLDRYDGYEFRHYRIDPSAGHGNVVRRLLEDSRGNLWVGSRYGLYRFDRKTEQFRLEMPAAKERDPPANEVGALFEDASGTVWAGVGSALLEYDEARSRFDHHLLPSDLDEPIRGIQQDRDERLWVMTVAQDGTRQHLHRMSSEGVWQRVTSVNASVPGSAFMIDSRGTFWLARGPDRAPGADGLKLAPAGVLTLEGGLTAVEDHADGSVWIGTQRGLRRFQPETGTATELLLDSAGDNWLRNYVVSLLRDRAGSMWVGTLGGLFRHDPNSKPFRHLEHDPQNLNSLSGNPVSAVVEDANEDLWVATFGSGLNRVDRRTGTVERFRHAPGNPESLCTDDVWALHVASDGRLWIGGIDKLCTLDASRRFTTVEIRPPEVQRDDPFHVRVIDELPNGRLWVASLNRGLFVGDTAAGRWRRLEGPATSSVVTARFVGPREAWFGQGVGPLIRLDPKTEVLEAVELRHASDQAFGSLEVFAIHRSPSGLLLLGTDRGLGRFNPADGTLDLPMAETELAGAIVYSILEDEKNRLWLGTNRGLTRLDLASPRGQRVRTFELAEGVGNLEFNRNAAYLSRNGEMLFGGMRGLTVFHPSKIEDNPHVPPVVLTGIHVLGEEGERELNPAALESLTLEPADYAVSFDFAALNFTLPEKNRYAYKLEGLDSDWIEASVQRSARYTSLPAGKYVLRIKGSNNDGIWNEVGVSLPVRVLPPFWHTWWFRLGVLAAVGVLLYIAYRVHMRRLRELELMRLQIASDLHDEMGSELAAIALTTAMVGESGALSEDERAKLSEVVDSSQSLTQRLRDIVWYINPEEDRLDSTVSRMRSVARSLLGSIEYDFETNVEDGRVPIEMKRRGHLLLSYRELLTNIVRHSQAHSVAIRLSAEDEHLVLEVEDDGVGFDPEAPTDGSGLRGMRRRAELLRAELTVDCSSGQGTRVRLRVAI